MKLYTYEFQGRRSLGVEMDGRIVDLRAAYAAVNDLSPGGDSDIGTMPQSLMPPDMLQFLRHGEQSLNAARQALSFATQVRVTRDGEPVVLDPKDVKPVAPVPQPGKVLCAEANYRGPGSTGADALPAFTPRVPGAVVGLGDPIRATADLGDLDCGVELAVVLRAPLENASEQDAMAAVAGYTILNRGHGRARRGC